MLCINYQAQYVQAIYGHVFNPRSSIVEKQKYIFGGSQNLQTVPLQLMKFYISQDKILFFSRDLECTTPLQFFWPLGSILTFRRGKRTNTSTHV